MINCHTHIFTSETVPPHIAKSFVPPPFYYLLNITVLVKLVQWYFNSKKSPYRWPGQRWYIVLREMLYRAKIATTRSHILGAIKFLVGVIIIISVFHEFYNIYISDYLHEQDISTNTPDKIIGWLDAHGILIITNSWLLKGLLLVILLTFFPSGKNLLLFLLKKFSGFFKMLPGKETTAMLKRYMNIVRFSRYKDQSRIFDRLIKQYPEGAGMVVLPMDMEFMGAGNPPKPYGKQMEELAAIKVKHPNRIFPFVFVDPRREKVGNETFFDYEVVEGKVVLKPCFIKTYIEDKEFSGFKIYPALGYFPFDERLLPLWKYAADNGIPILTHCIRGTIFYRGKKKKEWDTHPVFEQYEGDQDNSKPVLDKYFKPLRLHHMRPVEVQEIFTHPMNYACLLYKQWLTKLVAQAKDPRIQELFGYSPGDNTIEQDLKHLKLCFGHYGGEDEWLKFMEKDRDNYAQQLNTKKEGITIKDENDKIKRGLAEQLWKKADWYSIISTLMLQHSNVYADISYILHGTEDVIPLLRQTLRNDGLLKKVLYGTDFYVVRNHKSDKLMLADMMNGLSEAEFDLIARDNPREFLKR